MSWIEAGSGVKFFDFGSYKPGHTDKEAFLLKKGESVEAEVLRVEEVEKTNASGEEYIDYKYRLRIPGVDEDVLMWANTSIRGQQEILNIVEDEHIRIHYIDDYKTNFGSSGRNVKIAVDREPKHDKKRK